MKIWKNINLDFFIKQKLIRKVVHIFKIQLKPYHFSWWKILARLESEDLNLTPAWVWKWLVLCSHLPLINGFTEDPLIGPSNSISKLTLADEMISSACASNSTFNGFPSTFQVDINPALYFYVPFPSWS